MSTENIYINIYSVVDDITLQLDMGSDIKSMVLVMYNPLLT